jgi:hypothetical protein
MRDLASCKTMSYRKIISVIFILSLLALSLIGCRSYKSISLKEGIGRFSFEYSPRFIKKNITIQVDNNAETYLLLETAITYYPHIEANVAIHVEMAGDRYINSCELLDLVESDFDRDYQGCQLLGRSEKYIDGLKAEELIFSFNEYKMDSIPPGSHIVSTPSTTKIIAFDYDNKVWVILLTSHESYLNQVESDFNHILETFKIIG